MSFRSFEDHLLVGAFFIADEAGDDDVRVGDILNRFSFETRPGWIRRALKSFIESGYSDDEWILGIDDLDHSINLTPRGFKRGEELSEAVELYRNDNGLSTLLRAPSRPLQSSTVPGTISDLAPASDRIIRFDHNLDAYTSISAQLSDVRESIRGINEADPDEKDRVYKGLDAAVTLWTCTQLKIVQIRVGILLALEDAAKLLTAGAKQVAASLLIDAIKSFFKTHGVDLDKL